MADGPAPGVNSAMLASMREHSGDSHPGSGSSAVGGSVGAGNGMNAAAFGGQNFTDTLLSSSNLDGSLKTKSLEDLSQIFGEGAMSENLFEKALGQNMAIFKEQFPNYAETGCFGNINAGDGMGLASNLNIPKSGPNPLMPSQGHGA